MMNLHPIENIPVSLSQIFSNFLAAFQKQEIVIDQSLSKEIKINHHGFSASEIQIYFKGEILIVEGLRFSPENKKNWKSFREYSSIDQGYNFDPSTIKYQADHISFSLIKEETR